MGTIRVLFAMLTLMAVAMLPGPSHALGFAAASVAHSHPPAAAAAHHHADAAKGAHRHDHQPCKTCSVACCAPAIAAVEAPLITAVEGLRLRPIRPQADRERPDAARSRALRPPTVFA